MSLLRPRRAKPDRELAALRGRIKRRLERALPAAGERPETLHAAMRHVALPPGKCLRGLLAYAAGRALGIQEKRLDGAAAAVELAHAYSLAHDDLPCMDDDDERRGRPACHRVYGEATAMLAGNALLLLAVEETLDDAWPAERAREAARMLTRACGSQGMAGGQQQDLAGHGADDPLLLEETCRRKTGCLIHAAVALPGLLADADQMLRETLDVIGLQVGMAFQIRDDLKDMAQDGVDTRPSYPTVLGVEASLTMLNELRAGVAALLEARDRRADLLRELCRRMMTAPPMGKSV